MKLSWQFQFLFQISNNKVTKQSISRLKLLLFKTIVANKNLSKVKFRDRRKKVTLQCNMITGRYTNRCREMGKTLRAWNGNKSGSNNEYLPMPTTTTTTTTCGSRSFHRDRCCKRIGRGAYNALHDERCYLHENNENTSLRMRFIYGTPAAETWNRVYTSATINFTNVIFCRAANRV